MAKYAAENNYGVDVEKHILVVASMANVKASLNYVNSLLIKKK